MRNILLILLVCTSAIVKAQFTTSTLPIVVVNTNGDVVDDPKVKGTMGIIDNPSGTNNINDPVNDYNGGIGIEIRGNSTQMFEKKSYTVQLWNAQDSTEASPVLGMAADSDWILHAMYIDKSLLRIPMSFYLSQQMGHYATNYRFVELVLNGDYRGVYILCEKIKQGQDRVNVSPLSNDVTGGYILRIDWEDGSKGVESNYASVEGTKMLFQYFYPKNKAMSQGHKDYLKSYIDDLENAIFSPDFKNGSGMRYDENLDMESFVDFLLINELSKNSDGYKLSTYMHKDLASIDDRLKAGPIWDFDQAFGLSTVCSGHDHCGWTYLQNKAGCEDLSTMPLWWENFTRDSVFCNVAISRWQNFRQSFLHTDSINGWIDQRVAELGLSQERNFVKWPVLGEVIWSEPTPFPTDYTGEIEYLKAWIKKRSEWMDRNISTLYHMASEEDRVKIFPNPTNGDVSIYIVPGDRVEICDLTGRRVWKSDGCTEGFYQINASAWAGGGYMVYTTSTRGVFSDKLVIQK